MSNPYDDLIEQTCDRYADRAKAILSKIKTVAEESGMTCDDPIDMHDDNYRWTMSLWPDGLGDDDEARIDLTIALAEERDYDDEEGYGISFALDIVRWGGEILGGLSPYNYTDQCWVDARDAEAVEERFAILESANMAEAVALCE